MGRKSVAVLDIRSTEITLLVGERGVNHTFLFRASSTKEYAGYEEKRFLDEEELRDVIVRLVNDVEKSTQSNIRELYIGVPSEFLYVQPLEQVISFPKKRKIGEKELETLFRGGRREIDGYRFIRATSMIYVTADNRRVVDPTGLVTTSIHGVLSYFYCSEYFASALERVMKPLKIAAHYIPTELAIANYLIPSETRDEYALLLDVGCCSSTIQLLLGNGVLAQDTFPCGKGTIAADIINTFPVPYRVANALIARANLFAKTSLGKAEYDFGGNFYTIDMDKLVEIVKRGMDEICTYAASFLDDCSGRGRELDYKPLYVTGEGVQDIRGALEHFTRRINRETELLVPQIPYYNKPSMSSRIALADMAYEDHLKGKLLYRLFN